MGRFFSLGDRDGNGKLKRSSKIVRAAMGIPLALLAGYAAWPSVRPPLDWNHIQSGLEQRVDREYLLDDSLVARQETIDYLDMLDHQSPYGLDYDVRDDYRVGELTEHQFAVVRIMLDALQDEEFRNEIGDIIQEDLARDYTEMAGYFLMGSDGEVTYRIVESTLATHRDAKNNATHAIPRRELLSPHMAHFHLHATAEHSPGAAGPSPGVDDKTCESWTLFDGEEHCFIIASLEGNRFAIDFYGTDYNSENPIGKTGVSVITDLGVYSYEVDR